jgi:tRNA U34 5-carboxymethylaminomethyl modifying GTPase MnmE/TrmE|tara:strand:- start:516 stop:722 length:207 start_codon:yes stop_codon:yes gene_type:complete
MTTIKSYRALNQAPIDYEEYDESMSRRTIEQNFQDVSSDIQAVKVQADRDASLSLRKYQFLLLGASNG